MGKKVFDHNLDNEFQNLYTYERKYFTLFDYIQINKT